jgi:hypothetical protein
MKGKRFISLLLTLALLAGALPAHAAVNKVKVTRTSGDFLSGYYVVYNVDGVELRSDELGANTNYDLFQHLSTADKKQLMNNYAFGPGWLQEQFGTDNVAKMNDWWNDDSGWAGAKKVLEDRIAKRDFPRAESAFGGTYQQKSAVTLPEVEHEPSEAYGFLPAVREYLDLCREMEVTFNVGQKAYDTLKKTKMAQTSAAITSLSGDLISLIVERALVPGITPGGLSALAPSFSGELIGLVDKMTGCSDKVIEMTVGKRVDAATARKVIDECWQIIELNEQYTEQCISHFLSLKGQKASKYAAAAAAIDKYIEENEASTKAVEDAAESTSQTGSSGALQVSDLEELDKMFEAFYKRYDAWYRGVQNEESKLSEQLGAIKSGACSYSGSWPEGPVRPDEPGPLNLSYYYSGWYASTYYDESGTRQPTLPKDVADMPAAFSGAKAEAASDIAELDAYIPLYDAWAQKVKDEWPSWRAQWMSYKAAYAKFNITKDPPDEDIKYLLIVGYQDCGSAMHWTDSDYVFVPLSEYREELVKYQEMLAEHESQWNSGISDVVAKVTNIYNVIRDCQEQHAALLPEVVAAKEKMAEIIEQAEADYGRYELNQDLADRFASFEYDDFDGYRALYDQCGADLSSRWEEYSEARDTYRRGLYELEWLEEKVRGVAGITYGDFGGDQKLVAEAIGGGQLKSYDEMVTDRIYSAGHLGDDGSNLAEAGGTDPNAYNLNLDASYFKHFYEEFTGLNNATAEAGLFFDEIIEWKGKYMRADEEARTSLERSIKQNIHTYIQHGDYATMNFKYTSDQYFPVSPMGGQRVSSILNGWRSEGGGYTPVTGLSAGKLQAEGYDLTLLPGESYDLGRYVTVTPANATDKSLLWETTNDMICEVSESGVLTANQSGEATVTVRALDSDFTFGYSGERVYAPEPISFTVRVSTGAAPDDTIENDAATWNVYGGELYDAVDNGDGTTTVSLGVGMMKEGVNVAAALYTGDGMLVGLKYLVPRDDFKGQPAAFTAENGSGLVLKVFALEESGFVPMAEPILETTIK